MTFATQAGELQAQTFGPGTIGQVSISSGSELVVGSTTIAPAAGLIGAQAIGPGILTLNPADGPLPGPINIQTSGDFAHGSEAIGGGTLSIGSSAFTTSITTLGDTAYGLHSISVDSIITANNTKISTSGEGAFGALVEGGGSIMLSGSTIEASGVATIGATAGGSGSTLTLHNVQITVTSNQTPTTRSYGLTATSDGLVTAINASIITTGFGSYGVDAQGGTVNLIGGSVTTTNDFAFGLLSESLNGSFGNLSAKGATIATQGQSSQGAISFGTGDTLAISGSTVKTSGLNAFGLYAQNGGQLNSQNNTILTQGQGAWGMNAEGGTLNSTGDKVSTIGDGAVGLISRPSQFGPLLEGMLSANNVAVLTSGNAAYGAEAQQGSTLTVIGGTITTNGAAATALVADGGTLSVSGSVGASNAGDIAHVLNGGVLESANSTLTGQGEGIVASGGSLISPNIVTVIGGSIAAKGGDGFQVNGGFANITVQSDARITAASGNILTVTSAGGLPSSVVFTANGVTLTGNIISDAASNVAVNLIGGTLLTGQITNTDTTIDPSRWDMTASSSLKSLTVAPGSIVEFLAPADDSFKTLTLGRLGGTGGTFEMTVDLPLLNGDLIDITGSSAGAHELIIANPDQSRDPPSGSALKVVNTGDGVAVFGSRPLEAGTYLYFLARGNGRNPTPNPDDWYLVAAASPVPVSSPSPAPSPTPVPRTSTSIVTITPVPTQPVLTNTANAAIGTYSGTIPLFYEDMVTLVERMGELRLGIQAAAVVPSSSVQLTGGKGALDSKQPAPIPTSPATDVWGVWVRGFGSSTRINNNVSRVFDQIVGGFQIGADKRFGSLWSGDVYVGVFGGYIYASRDFRDGGAGSTNALSLGTYATWIHPQGWYADMVLKYSQMWNDFSTPNLEGSQSTGNYDIPTVGGSLEVGRRFEFAERRFFIEPQAQLDGVWEDGMDYAASNGLRVHGDDQTSLRGRLGGRLGIHFELSQGRAIEPYVKAEVIEEFLTGNTVRTNSTNFDSNLAGTTGRFGGGLAARISQSIYIYGEYDYLTGDHIEQPWSVDAGLRWQW